MERKVERYAYIDNLRLLMIVFVVMLHFAVTYSGFGGWYYKEGVPLDLISTIVFGYSMSYTQGYFMGFLFLISGFFTPGAFDKKGLKRFLKDRFIRLGVPTLFFMLVIHPFTEYFLLGFRWPAPRHDFIHYYWWRLKSFQFLGDSGPLWFAFAVLIFSCIYALVRLIKDGKVQDTQRKEIKAAHIVLLALLISASAFIIRLIQPIGTSIMNMQLCYFSQYIFLFITGVYAYRNNWFSTIQNRFGLKGLIALVLGGLIPWSVIMAAGGAVNGSTAYMGGMNWQSASFALWESSISVGTTIVLIALFREAFNHQNRLVKVLSDNAFAVYVFHTPIIVYLSLLLRGLVLPPLAKWLLLSGIGVPACFLATYFIFRRIPILKRIL